MAAILVLFLFSCILTFVASFLNSKFLRIISLKRGNKGSFARKQKNTKIAAILNDKTGQRNNPDKLFSSRIVSTRE